MANESNQNQPHELRLQDRVKLSVSGVQEVESFDENAVMLHTARGILIIRGEGLHLQTLSIDGGLVTVDGSIDALTYEEPQKTGGFFRRIFR